jgi:putative DNA primase/helicase
MDIFQHLPRVTPPAAMNHTTPETDPSTAPPTQPVIVRLSQVEPEPVQWLWPHRLPLGKLSLLLGEPAVGKSLLALDLAARLSSGAPWPDSTEIPNEPGGVVLLATEDTLADVVRPRLDAAGADHSRITAVTSVRRNILSPLPLSLRAACLLPGLVHLETAIQNTPDCRLVIIDPLTRSFNQAAHSSHADTRAVIEPLAELAQRCHVAVLALHQAPRTARGFAVQKMLAKLSPGAARTAWALVPAGDSPDRRFFLPVKNTVSQLPTPLACSITRHEHQQAPAVVWEQQAPDIPAELDVSRIATHEDRRDAADWLRDALARGPVETKEIFHEAELHGYSQRLLRHAFRQLQAIRARQKLGSSGIWYWALPDHEQQLKQHAAASW